MTFTGLKATASGRALTAISGACTTRCRPSCSSFFPEVSSPAPKVELQLPNHLPLGRRDPGRTRSPGPHR